MKAARPVGAADLKALWGGGGWGFDPFTVHVAQHLFAGARDTSLDFCRRLAQASPHTTLHEFPGGHHGFLAIPVRDAICAAVGAGAGVTQAR